MDQTELRGYPYPECNPPLTKDASDIAQVRNLAVAVDTDMQNLYDRATDVVVRPDACRMSMTATLADTANTLIPFFNSESFDTTTGGYMADTVNGVIRLQEPGWYEVGTYIDFTSATFLGARSCFLQNGARQTSFCTQAEIVAANHQFVHHTADIFVPVGGDTLSVLCTIGAGAPSYTYVARIWAQQVIRG